MNPGGLLTIRAHYAGHRLDGVTVDLRRPAVARLFVGQCPEAVIKTVPYLYTLCAQAQRAAAQAALVAAGAGEARLLDDGELWVEVLHENLWRLLLDWPAACGLPPAKEAFVAWRGERLGVGRGAATRNLLERTLAPLAEQCRDILGDDGPAHVGPVQFGGFPALQPEAWLAVWQGLAEREPEPERPHSIAAAYRRRLAETVAAAQALADGRPFPVAAAGDGGWGVGQTLTARGVLTHAAHVEAGKVANYRVWAPTDSHFADARGLAALLADAAPADRNAARQWIDRAVLALDPCLPYVVEFDDA